MKFTDIKLRINEFTKLSNYNKILIYHLAIRTIFKLQNLVHAVFYISQYSVLI